MPGCTPGLDRTRAAGRPDERAVGPRVIERVELPTIDGPARKRLCGDMTRGMGWHLRARWSKIMHATHGNSTRPSGSGTRRGAAKDSATKVGRKTPAPRARRVRVETEPFEAIYERVVNDIVKEEVRGSEGEWAENARAAAAGLVSEPDARGEADAISFVDQLDEVLDQIGRSDASLTLTTRFFEAMQFTDEDAAFAAPTSWAIATPARKCLQFTPSSRTAGDGGRSLKSDEEVAELREMVERLTAKVKASETGKGNDEEAESKELRDKRNLLQRRLRVEAASTRTRLESCVQGLQEDDLWPWEGTTRSARLARDKCLKYYSAGQRCTDYYEQFLVQRGLKGTPQAEVVMFGAAVLDAMLVHDQTNIMNLASAEIVVRKLHGHEESLKDIWCAADVKKAKKSNGGGV